MSENTMNQRQEILEYLEFFGSITRFEAFRELGITDLPKRISELIRDGVKIDKKMKYGKNRRGKPTHWMIYSLAE